MPITIGSVPYLNARPLVEWFTETEEGRASGVRIIEAVPSRLKGMVLAGEVACAMLSSVTFFQQPGWGYSPGAAIGSYGPVESVRLFTRKPVAEIETVALDASSLTSVALTKILLEQRFGLKPRYATMPPSLDAMLREADAALLIGDNGFRAFDPDLTVLDLGEEWTSWTGLPFVYALWLGPEAALTEELQALLLQSKQWGISHIDEIAERCAERHGKSVADARHYMMEAIRYEMGPDETAGLLRFGELLKRSVGA